MADETDILTAEQRFVIAGTARVAAPLADLNALGDRLGGQNGMMVHAISGSLAACFAALLNHIAGVPEPEPVPHETDPSVDRGPSTTLAPIQGGPETRLEDPLT